MAGLVGYESSDEDDEVQEEPQKAALTAEATKSTAPSGKTKLRESNPDSPTASTAATRPKDTVAPSPADKPGEPEPGPASKSAPASSRLGPVLGPALGPAPLPSGASPSASATGPQRRPLPEPDSEPDPADTPRSPTSAARALLRDLTLPAVPNMDIPASPPQSSSADADADRLEALSGRLDTFLEMKRSKGVHFNARLAGNAALRNPALMDKLLAFAGVETSFSGGDDSGTAAAAGQYASTLPSDVWDPGALPSWAYRTPLRRAQEKMQRERERGRGDAVEFVSAAAGPSGGSSLSRGGTPGAGSGGSNNSGGKGGVAPVTGKRKSRFDT